MTAMFSNFRQKIGGLAENVKFAEKLTPSLLSKKTAFWDRCYDFLNIFAEKISEKIGVFYSKHS
jgi:hypothetical protein